MFPPKIALTISCHIEKGNHRRNGDQSTRNELMQVETRLHYANVCESKVPSSDPSIADLLSRSQSMNTHISLLPLRLIE